MSGIVIIFFLLLFYYFVIFVMGGTALWEKASRGLGEIGDASEIYLCEEMLTC